MARDWDVELYESFRPDRAALEQAIAWLAPSPQHRVLDYECGDGYATNLLAAHAPQVTGADNSPALVAQARINHPQLMFRLSPLYYAGGDWDRMLLHPRKPTDLWLAASLAKERLLFGGVCVLLFPVEGHLGLNVFPAWDDIDVELMGAGFHEASDELISYPVHGVTREWVRTAYDVDVNGTPLKDEARYLLVRCK